MAPWVLGLDAVELDRLVETFAAHELGRAPDDYARGLERLATAHRLGLVADIWSPKERWLAELERAGVLGLFETLVFSSDHGSVKPSPRPFQIAMQQMDVPPSACVVIGDNARRDVGGARAAGIEAVWIGEGEAPPGARWAVKSLLELVP